MRITDNIDEGNSKILKTMKRVPLVDEQFLGNKPRWSTELTIHEKRILQAYSYGLNSLMVADMLGISHLTVLDHLKTIKFKLAAKNIAHAVATGIRLGVIK